MGVWQHRIKRDGLSVLSMKELSRSRIPPFNDKRKWPVERRNQLVRDLLDLFHSIIIQAGGAVIGTRRDTKALQTPINTASVYLDDMLRLVRFIRETKRELWPDRRLDIMFAAHPEVDLVLLLQAFYSQWNAASDSVEIPGLHVQTPSLVPGLQTADMIAFLFTEQVKAGIDDTTHFMHLVRGGKIEVFREERL
jgi:hypothetical protein